MSKTLAILGGGQLAQMMGEAAKPLGIRCRSLDPSPDACAARTCELITGRYDDPDAIARLVDGVDALTFEFENVPASALIEAEKLGVRVSPNAYALQVASDRKLEKELFVSVGMQVPPYRVVSTESELLDAAESIGAPLLLKARSGGYDGHSQARVRDVADALEAWDSIGRSPCLAESMVTLEGEVSVIACRSQSGHIEVYPIAANEHRDGILVRSCAPASVDSMLADQATDWTNALLDRLGYVGVLALELFITADGLQANEFAPRVHNTGHSTIEGNATSQFENHVRAVMGLDLGSAEPFGHAVMRNFIGSIPARCSSETDGAFWHDYGKAAHRGRKLGHATFVAATPNAAAALEDAMLGPLAQAPT